MCVWVRSKYSKVEHVNMVFLYDYVWTHLWTWSFGWRSCMQSTHTYRHTKHIVRMFKILSRNVYCKKYTKFTAICIICGLGLTEKDRRIVPVAAHWVGFRGKPICVPLFFIVDFQMATWSQMVLTSRLDDTPGVLLFIFTDWQMSSLDTSPLW